MILRIIQYLQEKNGNNKFGFMETLDFQGFLFYDTKNIVIVTVKGFILFLLSVDVDL